MEKKETTSTLPERKRKLYMALPVLAVPFICLAFHALGGGSGTGEETVERQGFNPKLPAVQADGDSGLTKMGLYQMAERDSMEREKQLKSDPYRSGSPSDTTLSTAGTETDGGDNDGYADDPFQRMSGKRDGVDPNEQKVVERLEALNTALRGSGENPAKPTPTETYRPTPSLATSDVDRLEGMMRAMQDGGGEGDPEMEQINRTLESILDIQHPERVRERLRKVSEENNGRVFAVENAREEAHIGLLDTVAQDSVRANAMGDGQGMPGTGSGFYGLDEDAHDGYPQNAIEAVVHEDQVLVSGSTVKLRLVSDIFINGRAIPAGSFVHGAASLKGERLEVAIESIRSGNDLFPVKLSVYDLDGMQGIRIPGSISSDVAKQSGVQAVSGISPGMIDPSVGAQAASAGIELSKNLLSKKIKLVKVEVKAGYRVLLNDGNQRDR